MVEFLKREEAPELAYVKIEASEFSEKPLPTIMFLGGFRSDMQGTKALYLEAQCKKRNQAYIRFDYRGHGQSGGIFEEACISEWAQDALDILNSCTSGSVMLVGSSMGGWIAFLLTLRQSKNIHSIVGVAAAPDFTTWIEEGMSAEQCKSLETSGSFEMPSDYNDPYIITKKLIEDGQQNILLGHSIDINVPVRLVQGMQDTDVAWKTAERIKNVLVGNDTEVILLEDADHRLSSADQLEVINQVICDLL